MHPTHLSQGSRQTTPRTDLRLGPAGRFFKILLVTSLYLKILGCREPAESVLKEINHNFRLVTCLDALWIPAMFSHWLWRHLDVKDLITRMAEGKISVSQARDELIGYIPSIGRYNGIEKDVRKVMECAVDIDTGGR